MKKIPKPYQRLLQTFKTLIITEYGLDEEIEEENKLVKEIQTAPNFKEVAEILTANELDGIVDIIENTLQNWFSIS